MRILLADDDQDFAELTGFALRRQGHDVTALRDGCRALRHVLTHKPELVLLSAEIDGCDGLALCRDIRERSSVPIILVSPHGDEVALVRGYEAGADDYVVKPFSPRQLLLRIDAVVRRLGGGHDVGSLDERSRISVGDLVLDPPAFEVRKNGVRLAVTRLEFRLLSLLLRSAGTLVESSRLIEYAWQASPNGHRSLLKTHISHIRQKLNDAGGCAVTIRSISRLGYLLSCDAEESTAPQPGRPVIFPVSPAMTSANGHHGMAHLAPGVSS
jgi:DNA-binding response OmpR family regulator